MKNYKNEAWLRDQYLRQRKKPEVIAKECNVTSQCIRIYIRKFKLVR